MRLLVEIVIVALLIGVGWNRSFRDWASDTPFGRANRSMSSAQSRSLSRTAQPQPLPTVSGSWMWEKGYRIALDRPAYKPTDPDPRLVDADGRTYRLDDQGRKLYER